jgi:hypothetical protein
MGRYANALSRGTWADTASPSCELPTTAILFSHRIEFADQPTVPVRVSIPTASELLLQAEPRSVDVQLMAPEWSPAADNPVRRFGARRWMVSTEDRTNLLLTLTRKRRAAEGLVLLQRARLSVLNDSCARAYRSAASAGVHYAQAQSPTIAGASAPTVDAKSKYQSAASE